MTDSAALLRAVLEHPDDDTPRLAYADWLDDHVGEVECVACFGKGSVRDGGAYMSRHDRVECGRCAGTGFVSNLAGERAAFVRVQVKLAEHEAQRAASGKSGWRTLRLRKEVEELRDRERALFDAHKCQWFGDRWAVLVIPGDDPDLMSDLTTAVVRRGFVDELRLPLAALVGGECGRCGGEGRVESPNPQFTRRCPACEGTPGGDDYRCSGRTPGLDLAAVFGGQPVRTIRPVDVDGCLQEYESGRWFWRDDGVFDHDPRLPAAISPKDVYDSRVDAYVALSRRLVALGRTAAGLPPLP